MNKALTKAELEEIRDAEKWFNNSEYGKGRIAGFVTHLMVDYAKYYHKAQSLKGEGESEPYFGWCDVNGCKNAGCNGGGCWRDTGYWTVCSEHSTAYSNGESQPKMSQVAIKREKGRDIITGYLAPNK